MAIALFAWEPLLVLSLIDGMAWANAVDVPFLYDFEVHVRLLFSLPLLVFTEMVVYIRMRAIAAQFVERQIIIDNVRPAFDAVLSSAIRLRNSVFAEIAMLFLVVLAGPFIWRGTLALHSDTWYATVAGSSPSPTLAGRWYARRRSN